MFATHIMWAFRNVAFGSIVLASCIREPAQQGPVYSYPYFPAQQGQPPQQQQQQFPQQQPQQVPQQQPQQPASPALAPAAGWACVSDSDLVCHFAHCNRGRCGGCTSNQDCKQGASCAATPFGAACMASLQQPQQQQPVPPPQPGPIPSTVPPSPPPGDPLFAARQSCLERTNAFRARANARPVVRRTDRETCGDDQARSDASANRAHATFGKCQEAAQNECPGYPGPFENVLNTCLQQMFDEGPGEPFSAHGHFLNMTNQEFKSVACGFHTQPDGSVWVVQNFYR